jgi:hypothetical protein
MQMKGKIILGAVRTTLFLFLFLAFGCATSPALKTKAFPAEEVRNVRILVIASQHNLQTVKAAINKASHLLEPQVGIHLEVSQNIITGENFPLLGREKVIRRIIEIVEQNNLMFGRDFDIAIWADGYSIVDLLFSAVPIPLPYFWRGIIDKGLCRCIIAVKSFNARMIAHEVIHSFMLDSKHDKGLERGFMIEILPGIPLIPLGSTLSEEAKAEIIKYKWRGFPELPKNPPIALVLDPSNSP